MCFLLLFFTIPSYYCLFTVPSLGAAADAQRPPSPFHLFVRFSFAHSQFVYSPSLMITPSPQVIRDGLTSLGIALEITLADVPARAPRDAEELKRWNILWPISYTPPPARVPVTFSPAEINRWDYCAHPFFSLLFSLSSFLSFYAIISIARTWCFPRYTYVLLYLRVCNRMRTHSVSCSVSVAACVLLSKWLGVGRA